MYNHIDEIWSIDLAIFSDYKTSNNKRFRYTFIINENFSKYTWCIPSKNKNALTTTNCSLNFVTTIKHRSVMI